MENPLMNWSRKVSFHFIFNSNGLFISVLFLGREKLASMPVGGGAAAPAAVAAAAPAAAEEKKGLCALYFLLFW